MDDLPSHIECLSNLQSVSFEDSWYELTSTDHFWMRWRLKTLTRCFKHLRVNENATLKCLDVGSGHGVLREQLEGCTNWSVDVSDLNPAGLSNAALGRGRTLLYDVTDMNPEMTSSYDLVFLCDVIEHLENPTEVLKSSFEHLKPGGWIIINVPAYQSLFSSYDHVLGHFRRYAKRTLRTDVRQALPGSEIQLLEYWGAFLVPFLIARRLMMGRKEIESEEQIEKTVRDGMLPPSKFFEHMFTGIMNIETAIPFSLGFGTSLVTIIKRSD